MLPYVQAEKPYRRLVFEFDLPCALQLWGRSERRLRYSAGLVST